MSRHTSILHLTDKVSTASLLQKFNMMSVNQINAQIKLSEMWKAVKDEDHPFNLEKKESGPDIRSMRSITNEVLPVKSFSERSKNTFINDGIVAWNQAPLKSVIHLPLQKTKSKSLSEPYQFKH